MALIKGFLIIFFQENEIQFHALFLSVDPYMRPYTKRMSPPFTMIGSSVAEVEETRNPNFKKGQTIVILAGWVERGIVNPDAMGKVSLPHHDLL